MMLTCGHMGIKKSLDRSKQCPFYRNRMTKVVTDYVRSCQLCGEANNPQRKKRHPLQPYIVGSSFERIAVDIAGPFPKTERQNSYILVVGDYFTKLVEIFPLVNIRRLYCKRVDKTLWMSKRNSF